MQLTIPRYLGQPLKCLSVKNFFWFALARSSLRHAGAKMRALIIGISRNNALHQAPLSPSPAASRSVSPAHWLGFCQTFLPRVRRGRDHTPLPWAGAIGLDLMNYLRDKWDVGGIRLMTRDLDKLASSDAPLFVTRYGLNERTAIGVQTLYLTKQFPHFYHLYWNDSSLPRPPRGSYRLESWAFCRIHWLRYDMNRKWLIMNRLEKEWEKTRWAWWRNDKLKINGQRILYSLQHRVSSVYFAPIDSKDARRMVEISNFLNKPYVVHLWDFLDGNIDDEATQFLIRNAKRVFCLNNKIANEVKTIRNAHILEFTRSPSNHFSSGVKNNCVHVALIGDIKSYLSGVLKLFEAIKLLKEKGINIKIIYIGKFSNIVKLGLYSKGNIEATGFIKDSEKRDRILSTCNVGFLPGPGASPEMDYRSKFSIPSRILDFLTAGLPVVGNVHPLSATFAFLRELDFGQETVCCEDPAQIAKALLSITESHRWSIEHQCSLKAFNKIRDRYNLTVLKEELV